MSKSNNESANKLKEAVAQFAMKWEASVALRLEACKIYADAIDSGSRAAKDEFENIPRFRNWTQKQWRFVYLSGKGLIDPQLVDYKNISVPIAFADRLVKPAVQRSIFRAGLEMYTVRGELITVKFKDLKVGHIYQVFDEDGNRRSMEEQIKYILDQQKPNVEVVSKGLLLVHHGCYLHKEELLDIITNPALGISIADIIEYKKGRNK